MSLRLEMLQVARLAPKVLGDSSALVKKFLRGQQNEDGGFRGRDGQSDLYYTVFGLEGLLALQEDFAADGVAGYLSRFANPGQLDFVHLCCLARGWANLAGAAPDYQSSRADICRIITERLSQFRGADGGFSPAPQTTRSTAYAGFLALCAYQDCQAQLPEPWRLIDSLSCLTTPDGAYTNDSCIKVGSTNATAAAVAVLRNLNAAVPPAVGDWLLARCLPSGGFLAVPRAPIPDLLSTATALHALATLQRDLSGIKEPCLDFLDTLWTNAGAFHGHWSDTYLDCEYTYYGLLALGHLS
jgi:prenyltransferase beta subunit